MRVDARGALQRRLGLLQFMHEPLRRRIFDQMVVEVNIRMIPTSCPASTTCRAIDG